MSVMNGGAVTKRVQAVRVAEAHLTDVRHVAKMTSVRAIRRLEEELETLLAGAQLRGLPNLLPEDRKFFGVRLTGRPEAALPFPMREEDGQYDDRGNPVLVLNPWGKVVFANRLKTPTGTYIAEFRRVQDHEIRAEDVEYMLLAVCTALTYHLTSIERTTAGFGRLCDLARDLADLLERPESSG